MGKLSELHTKIKGIFPEAIDFSADNVIQGGIYLLFNSITSESWREDLCSYSLLIASRSMNEDKDSILHKVDEFRERLGAKAAREAFNGRDTFKGVSIGNFTDTLYVYKIDMEFKIYREMENL
jgi:hypothetical protein